MGLNRDYLRQSSGTPQSNRRRCPGTNALDPEQPLSCCHWADRHVSQRAHYAMATMVRNAGTAPSATQPLRCLPRLGTHELQLSWFAGILASALLDYNSPQKRSTTHAVRASDHACRALPGDDGRNMLQTAAFTGPRCAPPRMLRCPVLPSSPRMSDTSCNPSPELRVQSN